MPITPTGEVDLYWEEHGDGPPFVWLPGTGLRGSTWTQQVEHFRDRFRCITVDLRGSGDSSGADTDFTVADLAEDVARLLDGLGVRQAVVAGLSLGSAVAQELAMARPDLVERLVLVATWSSSATQRHIRRHFESRLYALQHGPLDVYAQFAFWMSSPTLYDQEPDLQDVVEKLLREHMSTDVAGTAGHFRADLSHETTDRLPTLSVPTLVVHGDEDLITLPAYNRAVAAAVPGAQLVVLERAGHLGWLERAEELNAAVDAFVGARSGSA